MLPSNMSYLASNLCGVLIILLGCLFSVHCQSVSVSGIPSSAVKDDEITAICVTDGTLSPSWYRNDVLVTNIGTPIPLGTNQWRYTYTFTVDTNTKGVVFKCQAANPQDPSNISSVTKSIVDVYYTPILGPIILPLDNTMVEGNTVTFQLLIYNAYPAPAVTWTLQGVPLQSTISHSIGGIFYNSTSYCSHQLRSSDNKQTITASITHRSYDSGPRTVTATLDVKYPPGSPSVTSFPSQANENDQVTVRCAVVGGNPAPFVWWTRNDIVVDQTQNSQELNNELTTFNDYTFSVQVSDSTARFVCNTNNSVSSSAKQSPAYSIPNVFAAPSNPVISGIPDILIEGNVYTITCSVKGGYPASTMYWFREGVATPLASSLQGTANFSLTYTFTASVEDHLNAIFRCFVEHEVVNKTANHVIQTIYVTPSHPTLVGDEETNEGFNYTYTCTSSRGPKDMSLVFVFGGVELTTGTIESINPDGSFNVSSTITLHLESGESGSTLTCFLLHTYVLGASRLSSNSIVIIVNGAAVMPSHGKYALGFDTLVVKNVQTSDDNVQFRCLAMNDAGVSSISSSAILHAYAPPGLPVFYDLPSAIIEGVPVTLRCQSSGGWPYPVLRIFKGNTVLAGSSSQAGINTTISYSFNPTVNDKNSVYRCEASNQYSSLNATYTVIDVYVDGKEANLTGPTITVENERNIWICIVPRINPAPSVLWLLGGFTLLPHEDKFDEKTYLFMSSLNYTVTAEDHDKRLECIINNIHTSTTITEFMMLTVYVKPKTLKIYGPNVVNETEAYSWQCRVSFARPSPIIVWSWRNREILSEQGQYDLETLEFLSSLTQTVYSTDFGFGLKCTVRHSTPSTVLETTIFPVVYISLKFAAIIGPEVVQEGDTASWSCVSSPSFPQPVVHWMYGSEDIGANFSFFNTTNLVTTSNMERKILNSDIGKTLTCTIEHLFGKQMDEKTPNVYIKPENPTIIGDGENVYENKIHSWTCVVNRSNPVPTIYWLKDDVILSSNITNSISENNDTSKKLESTLYIVVSKQDMNKTITCLVNESLFQSEERTSILLFVGYAPTVQIVVKSPADVLLGTMFRITCSVQTNIGYTLQWYKDGIEIFENEKYSIIENDLKISSYSVNDDGIYNCRAINPSGTSSLSGNFQTIGYAFPTTPEISGFPGRTASILEGTLYFINCSSLEGIPLPSVTWYIGNTVYDNSFTGQINRQMSTSWAYNNAQLLIDITMINVPITCFVTNGFGNSSAVKILEGIQVQPSSPILVGSGSLNEGTTYTWYCNVDRSYPPVNIKWYIGTDVYNTDTTTLPTLNIDGSYRVNSSVTVVAGAFVHEKQLTCEVTHVTLNNPLTSSLSLFVTMKPSVNLQSDTVQVVEAETDVTIRCSVVSTVNYEVFWYKQPLIDPISKANNSDKYFYNGDNLLIRQVGIAEAGQFYCKAENIAGFSTASSSANVVVFVSPGSPIISFIPNGRPTQGNTVTIDCYSRNGNPSPTMFLYNNGSLIMTSSSIRQSSDGEMEAYIQTTIIASFTERRNTFRCIANNTYRATEAINMLNDVYVLPGDPVLTQSNPTLFAGSEYTFTCESDRGNPLPEIRWYLDGQLRTSGITQEDTLMADGYNKMTSSITYQPSIADDGKILNCSIIHTATNTFKSVSKQFDILYIPHSTTIMGFPAQAIEGVSVTVSCSSFGGNPPPTLSWFQTLNNKQTLVWNQFSPYSNSTGDYVVSEYTFTPLFKEFSAVYTCSATNTAGARNDTAVFQKIVVVPTQPSLLGNFTTLLDGRTYTWECVTSRVYPVPIFSWTVGSTLPSQLRHQISFNTEVNADGTFLARSLLTISPVQAATENGRVIRCQVSHGETGTVLNVTRTLTVHERPSVNISKTQQDIINGTFVNVICYVTSTLDVVVTWLKDGNTLPTPPGNGVTITSNSGNSLLSIETAQEINQGRYSCRASNDVGDSVISSSFDLNVISAAGSPIISNFPTYPLESLTYDVECAALGGDPAPVVTWYKNGVMVDPSLMTSSTQTGTPNRYISTLSLRTTFEERASVYTCIVSNAVRNSSNDKTFTDVLVKIQENTVSQITGNTIAREGVASSWSCEVNRSNPYPQITWFFDGVDVTSSATTNNPGPGLAQTFVSTITYTPNKNQNRKIIECVVTQTGDNLSAQIKRESSIVVEYRADTPVITGFPDVPIEGVSISATCTVTGGQPTPNVTWYRNGVLLKSVYESTPSGNINTLVFEPSINNIGDTFSCVAANPIGNVTSSKTISNVYVKPGVPKTNAIGDLLIGKTYSFWCNSTSGRPDPAIKWTLDNNDVGTSQFIPSTSGTRESASRVTFTAEGSLTGRVLRCTVSHPETNTSFTEAITITVHDKPTVTMSPLALNASLNQNKDLSCTVSTTLDAYNVSFYKEGSPNPILADQSKYWISKDPSNDRVTRLLIQSLEINDSGNYYCIAANLAGVSERPQSALLMLYTEPDITGLSPPSVVAKEGDRVDITCNVNVSPATFLTLTWTKGNTAISNQKTLTFTSINRNQDGNYVCSVSNSLGSDSQTATIAVQYKPEAATSDTDRTIEGTVGSLQTLTCATNSNPAPTEFVWLKDDQVLGTETGRSMEVRVESTNTIYKCRATNSVGVSSDISFFVSSSTASGASTGASTSEGGLTVAEIVVIVLCIVLFIVIIVVICFCCCLKAKEKDVEKEKEKKVERTRVAPQEDRFYKKPLPPPPGLYQRGSSVGDYEEDYVTSPDYTAFFIQAPRERDGTTISMGGHGGSPRQPRRLAPLAPLATNYEEEERRRKKARRNKKKKRQIQREDGVGMESPRHHANTETAEEIEIPEDTYTMSQKIFIGNDD